MSRVLSRVAVMCVVQCDEGGCTAGGRGLRAECWPYWVWENSFNSIKARFCWKRVVMFFVSCIRSYSPLFHPILPNVSQDKSFRGSYIAIPYFSPPMFLFMVCKCWQGCEVRTFSHFRPEGPMTITSFWISWAGSWQYTHPPCADMGLDFLHDMQGWENSTW